ncbi:MAG: hypothetical protein ABL963_04965 [Longimicrobiales bacterium]
MSSLWPFSRKSSAIERDPLDSPAASVPTSEGTRPADSINGLKVLLLDLPADAAGRFSAAGFRTLGGSLGRPFMVEQSDSFVPVPIAQTLPEGWAESEIVIIDLAPPKPADAPTGSKVTSDGEPDWWAKCSQGVVDPRPRVASGMRDDCDRIYRHGGAFIVFMAPELNQDLYLGSIDRYRRIHTRSEIRAHPWSFLTTLDNYLNVFPNTGEEIRFDPDMPGLESAIGNDLRGARYTCTLGMSYRPIEEVTAFALINKFDEAVALITNWEDSKGVIVLLPQVRDKTAAALSVVDKLIPGLVPDLFPDRAGASWLHQEPYEHPAILRLAAEVDGLRQELASKVKEIETRVGQIRTERGFLHDLMTESGDPLRQAVRRAFEYLGLARVVDVDAQGEDNEHGLMEDLRVEDRSPLLLVEVKGIFGKPTDEDALQVAKYLAPAMRRTGRTDVQGLTVINHERHRPAADRDHTGLFRPLVLENATRQGVGLLTTWDLFCLCRNIEEHAWRAESVLPVLYRIGRIEPVPEHYVDAGTIEKVWPDAEVIGLRIATPVSVGDRLAFRHGWRFHEAQVTSIHIDDSDVETAPVGSGAGVRLDDWRAAKADAGAFLVSE